MGYYKDSVIEEVRDKTDIVEIISQFLPLKKRGRNFIANCPFHNEKTPSFTVSPEKQIYRCFGCGAAGNVFTFLMEYEHLSFKDALVYLAEKASVRLESDNSSRYNSRVDTGVEEKKERLYSLHEYVARYFYKKIHDAHGEKAFAYIKKRGLSRETMDTFKIGYCPYYCDDLIEQLDKLGYTKEEKLTSGIFGENEKGVYIKFFNRLIFPIENARGKMIGFGGRSIDNKEPKYLNSPETLIFKKKQNLFALKNALMEIKKKNQVLITEGYMDVISLWQKGVKNAVASLGTAFTEEQARLVLRYTKEIVLVYDNDEAGQKATIKALEILRHLKGQTKVASLEGSNDPDDFILEFGLNAFLERIRSAKSSFRFLLDYYKSNNDYEDPEGKVKIVRLIQDEIRSTEDSILKAEYIHVLAEEIEIEEEMIRKDLLENIKIKDRDLPRKEYDLEKKTHKKTINLNNPSDKKELDTIQVILNYLEYGDLITEEYSLCFQNPILKSILERVKSLSKESRNLSALLDIVGDEEEKRVITKITLSEEMICPPLQTEEEFLEYLKALRKHYLTKEREFIEKQLVDAKKQVINNTFSELQEEWREVCAQLDRLNK